ncbi:MAG: helix-turn-helix transcriptional regulator [Actinobacteria bacterium]|nr:helix-turn-helix transcriptional regulator [Actinomycetota bacterium]
MTGRRRALADRRKAAGYSQERLAEAIRVEPSTVGRWERGETEPQPWFRPKLARALGISNQALGDLLGESANSETAAAAGPTGEHGEALHRDDLLNQSMADAAFPALDLDELQHLAAALTNAGRYLDSDVVSSFKRQLDICATDDGAHGPARTLPVVLGVVAAVERNARLVKPDVRRALLAVGAQGAEFVGWLYRDARQPRLSAHWRDRAIEWAQEADEWPMQGYVLLKKSQAAWDGRDGLRMLTLAQAAHNGPWELPPLVRAEVAQQEARGLAMIGEAGSVDAKLDEAWRVLDDVSPIPGELGSHYNSSLLTMQTAICYCEAGQPGRAAELYRSRLDNERFSHRDRGYFLSLMASASAQAAEPDNATDASQEALAIAVETSSRRTMHELTRVCALLEPWRARPAVRDLRDAVLLSGG